MAVVSLALFKKHVRADDFADDDEYLEHLLDTAESAVITATNRTKEECTYPHKTRYNDVGRTLVQSA